MEQILNEVRYWALINEKQIPKFEVYKYVKFDTATERYVFQGVRNRRSFLRYTSEQIDTEAFKPFLLNTPTQSKKEDDKHAAV